MYSVNEGDGSVDLSIFFIAGNAGEFIPHVITSTIDVTAAGATCYCGNYMCSSY